VDHVHATLAGEERRTLADDEKRLVAAVRALARRRVVLFVIADDHVHLVLEGRQDEVRQVVGDIHQALQFALATKLQPARCKEVGGRSHLENLVGYVLRQPAHHGLSGHPAGYSGSCGWDLVGARRVEGFDPARIRVALPRWRDVDFLRAMGLGAVPTEVTLLGRDLPALARAAGRAFAVPTLRGRTAEVVAARDVFAAIAIRAGFPGRAVAGFLGLGERWARKVAAQDVAAADVEVVLRQLALADALASRADARVP
jgi:REP element-mobilizing transposase RayT